MTSPPAAPSPAGTTNDLTDRARASTAYLQEAVADLLGLAPERGQHDAGQGIDGLDVQPLPGHARLQLASDHRRSALTAVQQLEEDLAAGRVRACEVEHERCAGWDDPDLSPTGSGRLLHRLAATVPIFGLAALETGLLYGPARELIGRAGPWSWEAFTLSFGFAVAAGTLAHMHAHAQVELDRTGPGRAGIRPAAVRRTARSGLAALACVPVILRVFDTSLGTGEISVFSTVAFTAFQVGIITALLLIPYHLLRRRRQAVEQETQAARIATRAGLDQARDQQTRLKTFHAQQTAQLDAGLAEAEHLYRQTFIEHHPNKFIADTMLHRGALAPSAPRLQVVPDPADPGPDAPDPGQDPSDTAAAPAPAGPGAGPTQGAEAGPGDAAQAPGATHAPEAAGAASGHDDIGYYGDRDPFADLSDERAS